VAQRSPAHSTLFLLTFLVAALLVSAAPLAAAEPQPGEELVRLAAELRADPTPRSYQRLARFAERYAESELSAQANFALGLADFEQKRWADARARFAAARSSAVLADFAALYQARAQMELGALGPARESLHSFSFASSLLAESALALEAEILARLGRHREAVELLEHAPGVNERPALLFALGLAQRAAGHPKSAAQTLNLVYYQFPLSAQAEPANKALSQIRAQMKTGFPEPSEALRRTRAELLWQQKAYRGARSTYTDLAAKTTDPAVKREAQIRAAAALYLLGSVTPVCNEIAAIAGSGGPAEPELRSIRARCAVRANDFAAAETELKFLAQNFPASEWYESALLAAGDSALTRGNKAQARDYYRRLAAAFPESRGAAEAHWRLTWLSYRGREPDATSLMQEHLERFPESPFLPRALYWRARQAVAAKQEPLAERLLAMLREFAPRDYSSQQGEILEATLQGDPAGDDPPDPPWLEALRRRSRPPESPPLTPLLAAQVEKADALARLSRHELATEMLDAALERQPHPALYLAQARVAFSQQKYARATVLLTRAYPAYWRYRLEDLPRQAWEIMYPKLYWDAIVRESRKNNLDPYLVAGLIRQESRFESEAVSSAGALGLMQLMPGTARMLEGKRLSRHQTFDAETNIRLGTKYLAQLLARFDGNLEKAVAGYNAGGARVEQWSSEGHTDAAEFVESIPIQQTREFVHTVLRNHRFYQDLYPQK
jgi:soluble lytic murein transglycosylase